MRMVFEGTAAEIADFVTQLGRGASPILANIPKDIGDTGDIDDTKNKIDKTQEIDFLSTDMARSVITRVPLNERHRKLLRGLYKRGDKYTSSTLIREKIGLTPAQFRGIMGPFGKRLAHTPGYEGEWFFDQEWDSENSEYNYRLPPSVREALELEKIV